MSTARLGATSYLVLGLVALRGPSTPYQLERAVGRTAGHVWSFPRSQLYDEPARLAGAGLLDAEREPGGRRRLTYTITEAGRGAIARWLSEPTTDAMEVRDMGQLKLFFAELGPADAARERAREQERLNRERLAQLEQISVRFEGREDLRARLAPLELGMRITRVAIEFWAEVADGRPAAGRRS